MKNQNTKLKINYDLNYAKAFTYFIFSSCVYIYVQDISEVNMADVSSGHLWVMRLLMLFFVVFFVFSMLSGFQ